MTWSDAARRASAEARKRKSKGRTVATLGRESMRMTPKPTPEQTDAAVRAAGQRAQARQREADHAAAVRSMRSQTTERYKRPHPHR